MTAYMARWRGETVQVVSVRGVKARVIRDGRNPRWVRLAELTEVGDATG